MGVNIRSINFLVVKIRNIMNQNISKCVDQIGLFKILRGEKKILREKLWGPTFEGEHSFYEFSSSENSRTEQSISKFRGRTFALKKFC